MTELRIGMVDKLIEVIGSPVIKQICDKWGYISQLNELQKTVTIIKKMLLAADSMQHLTDIEQAQIEDLEDVVHDADDLFDELLTLAELFQLDNNQDHKKLFLKKVRRFFSSIKKELSQAHKMTRMDKEIKKWLDSIDDNNKKVDLHEPYRQRREPFSHLNKEILGRDNDKRKVVNMLLNPDVRFLTIVGMGGIGKTTLAKLIFQDEVIQNEFPLRLWICVSDQDGRQFNVQDILCKILKVHLDDACSLELKLALERLFEQKYLIILDNVWNEDSTKWDTLKSFLIEGQKGSRILVTTRSKRTSNIIGNFDYELDGLSQEHSWKLFERLAFDERGHIDYLKFVEVGKKFVEKCRNVPLAIQIVSSLLYDQKLSRWRSLEESAMIQVCELEGNDKIMSLLRLSYDNLDYTSKRCFSYCALFPKNMKIKKDMLISLWMAQGYIAHSGEACQTLEDAAEEHFCTLLRRCFFQDAEENKDGDVISIKIHDLMHNMAQEVGKREICVLSSKSSSILDEHKIRHVHNDDDRILERLKFKSKIRSYVHPRCTKASINKQKIENLMYLRVLDLKESNVKILPHWISKLLHLRYLNLSENKRLQRLPSWITKLHNLQTLMLSNCSGLRELPKQLGKLVKLRHLDLKGCYHLCDMPQSMKNMSNMRVLPYFVVGDSCRLKCLKSFTELKGGIHILIDGVYRNDEEEGYLKKTKFVTSIKIEFKDFILFGRAPNREVVMEKLEPNSNVKEFILERYIGRIIPRWGTTLSDWAISFPHLVKINIELCRDLEELPLLSKLRYLKTLVLSTLKLEYIEGSSNIISSDKDDDFFPSLERLVIRDMRRLKGWWRWEDENDHMLSRRLTFPRLSHLTLHRCPSLKSFPLCLVQERGDNNNSVGLKTLLIDEVDCLKSMFAEGDDIIINPWKSLNQSLRCLEFEWVEGTHLPISSNSVQYLTSLQTLKFDFCENLEALPEWIGNLSSLQHLSIIGCEALKSLPESMTKLTSLHTIEILLLNSELEERCQKPNGEDWIKIQHIPNILINFMRFCEIIA